MTPELKTHIENIRNAVEKFDMVCDDVNHTDYDSIEPAKASLLAVEVYLNRPKRNMKRWVGFSTGLLKNT